MKKSHQTPFVLTLGTSLLAAGLGIAHADTTANNVNPFGITELSHGYMQFSEAEGMPAPEMKAPEESETKNMEMKTPEGKCGNKNMEMKTPEGKCGNKKMNKKAKHHTKKTSMKATEGKCGSKKMDSEMH